MAFKEDHELHKRRFGRNMGLLVVLLTFVGIVFGLTIVKVSNGESIEGFDHTVRYSLEPKEGSQ